VTRPRARALRALAVLLALVVVIGVAVLGVQAWRAAHRTDLQRAFALAPAGAERFSFTDWAGVRRELGADALSTSSPYRDVEDFLGAAYDRDLSSTSAMVGSAQILQERFGFSPASVVWELYSQSTDGAVVMLQMTDDVTFADVAESLTSLGYTAPADETGVWLGGADVVARISRGSGLTPEFQYVALDADNHLLLASDTSSYLELAIAAKGGDEEGGADGGADGGDAATGLRAAVSAAGDPVSAAVYSGDNACAALAMSQADESDQAQADQLISEAGEVDPLTGFAMAAQPDGTIRVAMAFENDDQARTNADTRATLASGPAVGQGGNFSDRFTIIATRAEGAVVEMDLKPVAGTFVVSDLSNGPVLFATC